MSVPFFVTSQNPAPSWVREGDFLRASQAHSSGYRDSRLPFDGRLRASHRACPDAFNLRPPGDFARANLTSPRVDRPS